MIRAVIFDMDGLLIDSEVYWEEARREYCADVDCTWRPEDELLVKGNNSPEWATAIAARCGRATSVHDIISAVTQKMRDLYGRALPLLPGSVETVREIAETYPLAIASSSPEVLIEYAMSLAGIRDCFQVVISADTVPRGKPWPDVFLEAARRLECEPADCAVFEDSSAGITSAKNAGMTVIAVPNVHYPPSTEALAAADVVLASLLEFRPSLLSRD